MLASLLHPRLLFLFLIAFAIYLLIFLFDLPRSYRNPRLILLPEESYQSRLLPHYYWQHRSSNPDSYTSESCTDFPQEDDIHYAAAHWQHMKITNGSVYVYGAHWDNRFEEPLVRVLVYSDVTPLPEIYCQLWYLHESAPHTVLAEPLYGWREEWGGLISGVNEPYILGCRASYHHHHPHARDAPALAVSLVTEPCERASNVLNVQGAPTPEESLAPPASIPSNTSVAACLKWLDYQEDVSALLVEWLQLLRYFQTDFVYIYVVRAHKNVLRVLDYYSHLGFVHVTELAHAPWLSPGTAVGGRHYGQGERDFHDYRRELLPLNDCLYRSLAKYRWLAVFDLDEIIVPIRDGTYQNLLSRELSSGSFDALVCRNVYYLDAAQRDVSAPSFARMLGHQWRAREPSGPGLQVKSFHNTLTVTAMHNHMPRACTHWCVMRDVNETDARLQHYRAKCSSPANSEVCRALTEDVIRDTSLERYRLKLLEDIPRVLAELDIPLPK